MLCIAASNARRESGSMSGAAAALSPRERYILELIGGGQSNNEIARALGIAPETVKSHVKNIASSRQSLQDCVNAQD
jgi:DNA-binding CsgD family transcriptional regulator